MLVAAGRSRLLLGALRTVCGLQPRTSSQVQGVVYGVALSFFDFVFGHSVPSGGRNSQYLWMQCFRRPPFLPLLSPEGRSCRGQADR